MERSRVQSSLAAPALERRHRRRLARLDRQALGRKPKRDPQALHLDRRGLPRLRPQVPQADDRRRLRPRQGGAQPASRQAPARGRTAPRPHCPHYGCRPHQLARTASHAMVNRRARILGPLRRPRPRRGPRAGREAIAFRTTRNGDDVTAALHPTAAAILLDYTLWRGGLHNREDLFFLTYRREPYVDNGRVGGGQNKTGFKAALRRARRGLLKEAYAASRQAQSVGRRLEAQDVLTSARVDARLLRQVTQHWFRHMLASRMRYDLRSAMEQGGWRDERSILGYIADVPQVRRATVEQFQDFKEFRKENFLNHSETAVDLK